MKAISLLICFAVLTLSSCTTFPIPKDYVPDTKVVYLTQNTDFNPISYKAVPADPYVFAPDQTPINALNPQSLQTVTWDKLLVADYLADSHLYRELEAHFQSILGLPAIKDLRTALDSASITATPPLPPEKGERIKEFTNGGLYTYPGVEGAQITALDGGYYEIVFADKSRFLFPNDGSYQRTDAKGQVVFALYPKTSQIVSTVDGVTYTSAPGYRALKGPQGSFSYSDTPQPQYHYVPANNPAAPDYTLFLDDQKAVKAVSIQLKNGLRFDYFSKKSGDQQVGLLVTNGNQAVAIDPEFEKTHLVFDQTKSRTTDLLSIYLPEGIRLTNFQSSDPAYGEVKPAWPEKYLTKAMGPFDVLYTAKDAPLVAKLKADRMAAIEANDRKLTGLSASKRRTIIIPPDLDSYRKLHASKAGEVLNWYPSGFETKDTIIMWPLSVPRYDAPAGQDYFFDKEFYEILVHEYVHVLVGENSGIAVPVPVWLNEGLAVYVETTFSPEVKRYWDVTFDVSRGLKRLLDWDLVTTTGTGELPVAKARVEYAQSYALVAALIQKFGAAKVAEYVRSFRANPAESAKVDLKTVYKSRFKKVFGVEFDQALKLLEPVPTKA